ASAVKTLAAEAGIESETLQRFLARNDGVAEGRLTRKGTKTLRNVFSRSVLVVDEASLASTVQMRNLLRIAKELRLPRVGLVGDEKQLDAVDAGKAFAQLQRTGMQTATMDRIMRQRNPELKAAVEASLAGEIGKAFEKLGQNVAEVEPDNIAGAVAARWLKLTPEMRERTGVMSPSHALRVDINKHIRERLAREGAIRGRAFRGERLVSLGYTRAEKGLAGNYAVDDVVAFHRPYKRLGVAKGDERRVTGVDHEARTVELEGHDGPNVRWDPARVAGFQGGSEVYRPEEIELRAGDRIRWTRNDAGLGLVNSRTAEVVSVEDGKVSFRLEEGRMLELDREDSAVRHLDHAWASTVHAFQGRTVDNVIAAMEASHPHLTTQKSLYVEISRARDRAELVTDDAGKLKEHLETATGERISALEGVGKPEPEPGRSPEGTVRETGMTREGHAGKESALDSDNGMEAGIVGEGRSVPREREVQMELEL
ncbi:MAG: AAA family ATPase, partial [Rhodospirillaceae bacterium]|nr:AAA family ATPase [Rhodospirillaceae bacterium]